MTPKPNPAAEAVARLENLIIDSDERLNELHHAVKRLSPTETTPPMPDELLTSHDPEVATAKEYIATIDAKRKSSDEQWYFPAANYNRAKRIISLDILTRCVFEIDGLRYQLTAPALNIRGKRYTAVEMMQDTRILRHLVSNQSSVKLIS